MPEHAETVMADGHASAQLGSIFTQLCLVWTTSMQVGHLTDHSGSSQHANTENNLAQSALTQGLVGGLSETWLMVNTALVSNC